jgi:hypothetical protein
MLGCNGKSILRRVDYCFHNEFSINSLNGDALPAKAPVGQVEQQFTEGLRRLDDLSELSASRFIRKSLPAAER